MRRWAALPLVSALAMVLPACGELNPFHRTEGESCTTWTCIVEIVRCDDPLSAVPCEEGISEPVPDVRASPPQVQMRVGEAIKVAVTSIGWGPAGCGGLVYYDPHACTGPDTFIHSSNPSVARIEGTAGRRHATVTARSPGDARIFAAQASSPAGIVRAPLTHCPDRGNCNVIEVVLRVLP